MTDSETVEARPWIFPPFAVPLRARRMGVPERGIALAFDGPRPLTALQRLKARMVEIGINGTRQDFEYTRRAFARWPELREL